MAIMTGIAWTSPVIRSGREERESQGGQKVEEGRSRGERERQRTPFQLFHFLAAVYLLLLHEARGIERARESENGNVFIISATKIIWEMTFSA